MYFQEKMNEFFNGSDFISTYIDDLLIISNKSLEDLLNKLDKGLSKFKLAGFKVNSEKSFFAKKSYNT